MSIINTNTINNNNNIFNNGGNEYNNVKFNFDSTIFKHSNLKFQDPDNGNDYFEIKEYKENDNIEGVLFKVKNNDIIQMKENEYKILVNKTIAENTSYEKAIDMQNNDILNVKNISMVNGKATFKEINNIEDEPLRIITHPINADGSNKVSNNNKALVLESDFNNGKNESRALIYLSSSQDGSDAKSQISLNLRDAGENEDNEPEILKINTDGINLNNNNIVNIDDVETSTISNNGNPITISENLRLGDGNFEDHKLHIIHDQNDPVKLQISSSDRFNSIDFENDDGKNFFIGIAGSNASSGGTNRNNESFVDFKNSEDFVFRHETQERIRITNQGLVTMTNNLDMNNNDIDNIKNLSGDGTSAITLESDLDLNGNSLIGFEKSYDTIFTANDNYPLKRNQNILLNISNGTNDLLFYLDNGEIEQGEISRHLILNDSNNPETVRLTFSTYNFLNNNIKFNMNGLFNGVKIENLNQIEEFELGKINKYEEAILTIENQGNDIYNLYLKSLSFNPKNLITDKINTSGTTYNMNKFMFITVSGTSEIYNLLYEDQPVDTVYHAFIWNYGAGANTLRFSIDNGTNFTITYINPDGTNGQDTGTSSHDFTIAQDSKILFSVYRDASTDFEVNAGKIF